MSMNKDQVKGGLKEAEGTVQEVAGRIVGNPSQEAQGNIKKTLGQLQIEVGDIKQGLKDSKNGA